MFSQCPKCYNETTVVYEDKGLKLCPSCFIIAEYGGEGSGNFGHAGRPGEVGGSDGQGLSKDKNGEQGLSKEKEERTHYGYIITVPKNSSARLSEALVEMKDQNDLRRREWGLGSKEGRKHLYVNIADEGYKLKGSEKEYFDNEFKKVVGSR